MGCCVSTNNIPNSKCSGKQSGTGQSPAATCPLPEKEAVKEVLYETTTARKFHDQDDAVYRELFVPCGHDGLSQVHSTAKALPTVVKFTGRGSEENPGQHRLGPGNERRKCGGESSGRSSGSPVTRKVPGSTETGLGRTQSSRKTNKSHGRVGYGSGEMIRKMDAGEESGEFTCTPTKNDLLENTHVSLECFIFL